MIGRRDLIRIGAGGAVGTALTPLPWKLLDDTAIWSQNWSWIPKVPRGEVTVRNSTCTLCPAGCGVKARCVGGRAVGVEGMSDHPLSHGALCPMGFGGHAAAYHPLRIKQPRGGAKDLAAAVKRGPFAILDLGPRRAVSSLCAASAAAHGGMYLRVPDRDEAFLDALAPMLGREAGTLGVDLEHTRTLISFGAPVLDNWATPGRVMERWGRADLHVVQIEERQSRTALAASHWIPALSAGYDFNGVEKPAVAVGDGDLELIARLNIQLGALSLEGGIVPRRRLPWDEPAARDLASVPDASLAMLFIDASRAYDVIPWPAIRRKLADKAVVVAFAYKEDALTRHADVVFPVAAPFETLEDVTTPPCSAVAFYATAPPLIGAAAVRETPVDHLNAILGASTGSVEETIKARVASLEQLKRGTVMKFGDCFVWTDAPDRTPLKVKTAAAGLRAPAAEMERIRLMVHSSRASDTSPLLTKLDQESGLYTPSTLVRMHPETARGLNLRNGERAVIETKHGSAARQVLIDPAVAAGVVEVAITPAADDITNICTDGSAANWRTAPATVRRS